MKNSLKPITGAMFLAIAGAYAACYYDTSKTCVTNTTWVGWVEEDPCFPNAHADGDWSSPDWKTTQEGTGRQELTSPEQCSGPIYFINCEGADDFRANFVSQIQGHDYQKPNPLAAACSD